MEALKNLIHNSCVKGLYLLIKLLKISPNLKEIYFIVIFRFIFKILIFISELYLTWTELLSSFQYVKAYKILFELSSLCVSMVFPKNNVLQLFITAQ